MYAKLILYEDIYMAKLAFYADDSDCCNRFIDWLIECWLKSNGHYFMHIQNEGMLMNDDDESCAVLDRHIKSDFNMLAQKINGPHENQPLYLNVLF